MKLTTLLFFAISLHVSAHGYSQKVTISEKNATLEKVFKEIKKQTGYSFFFDESWMKIARKVSMEVHEVTVETALALCFEHQPLNYSIIGNTVVVSLRENYENREPKAIEPSIPPILVKGIITDSLGKFLAGVSVSIHGSSHGTTTNSNGEFTLYAKIGDQLDISIVGYKRRSIKVTGNNELHIELETDTKSLSDVVITAFGIAKKESSLGYSLSTIGGEDIIRTNTINPITALQGKVAGVMVNVMSSSGVQTSPYIQIRGASVLGGNNQPIFVVDGNVLQNSLISADQSDPGSQLKDLNPDDYESITILKGAAATAIYGSRGINGVVVITTKRGKAGKGIGVEFNTTYSLTHAYKPFMDLQNEFGMGSYNREGAFQPGGLQDYATSNWGPAFDGTLHPAPWNADTTVPYIAQPGNWRTFFRNGSYVNNNVALSGGSERTHYRLSYSNTSDLGTLEKNGLNRNAVSLKVGGQVNRIFSYETGIDYANTVSRNFYNQSRYAWPGGDNIGFDLYYYPRNVNFASWHATYRNPDNSVKTDPIGTAIFGSSPALSAFGILDKNNYSNTENSFLAFSQVKAQVNSWLDLSGRGNINYLQQLGTTKNYGNGQFNTGGSYALSGSHSANYELLFMAHAAAKALQKDLNIDIRLMNNIYGNLQGESYSATTEGGLQIPNQFILSNSVNAIGPNGGYSYSVSPPSTLTMGVTALVDLSYRDYLTVGLSGRNDWLSTLTYPANVAGRNNYSVFYPAINASYLFYNHLHQYMPSWISSGRVWANIAEVGNAGVAGAYSTGLGFAPGTLVNGNGQSITTAIPSNANIQPNLNLKPQIQRGFEFGADLGFWQDLVHLNATWYQNNTFNQLMQLPGVPETGYNTLYINAGNIQNKGYEVSLTVNPIRTKEWNLSVAVNLAHNTSKIIKFYPGITSYNNTGDYEGAQVWSYQGGPYGVLEVRGGTAFQLDPKTGYPLMKVTPNSVSNAPDSFNFANYQYVYDTASLVPMGNIQPTLTGGLMINLKYRNFSLFTQLDGRLGGWVYSESYTYAMGQGTPLTSLKYRDKAHGGVARKDSYTGQTVYDGAVPNGIFATGQTSPITGADISGMTFQQAYSKGLVQPWYAPAYYDGGIGYAGTYDWENGLNYNGAVSKESWLMVREITLAYQLPNSLVKKLKAVQAVRLSLSVRNLGYLYNSLPDHQNPASIQSNNPLDPFITGGVPFERSYTATLNLRF